MKMSKLALIVWCCFVVLVAHTATAQTPPNDETLATMEELVDREYEDYKSVTVRILDKITARTRTFDLAIGNTVSYGDIRIKPRACRKTAPMEEPESAAFLQIWETKSGKSSEWIFSGWMFASSPSLSAMDHAIYDVWLIDCKNPVNPPSSPEVITEEEAETAIEVEDGEAEESSEEEAEEVIEEPENSQE